MTDYMSSIHLTRGDTQQQRIQYIYMYCILFHYLYYFISYNIYIELFYIYADIITLQRYYVIVMLCEMYFCLLRVYTLLYNIIARHDLSKLLSNLN